MSLKPTVLFDYPQRKISAVLAERMGKSSAISVLTGYATPGGLAAIAAPIKARPSALRSLVVGAATFPAFEALDKLLGSGVPPDRLYVHLGHTRKSGGHKHPFVRYHPMLHSKIYYMELPDSRACAFIGSHNVTSFALNGQNGEMAVMLEGEIDSPEFGKIRSHIEAARDQAVNYSPGMKEAYAWWLREFIEGLRAEIRLPIESIAGRTILLFAKAERADRPKIGENIYFEIPAGIEQIETLRTEAHLFLYDTLPPNPAQALLGTPPADAAYTCTTLGAENKQGNLEVTANWRIEVAPTPALRRIPSGRFRPSTASGMQQVRAEVTKGGIDQFEYLFERGQSAWDPEFFEEKKPDSSEGQNSELLTTDRSPSHNGPTSDWKLVKGLNPRSDSPREKDEAALRRAAPESGSFILVSLRKRRKCKTPMGEQ